MPIDLKNASRDTILRCFEPLVSEVLRYTLNNYHWRTFKEF